MKTSCLGNVIGVAASSYEEVYRRLLVAEGCNWPKKPKHGVFVPWLTYLLTNYSDRINDRIPVLVIIGVKVSKKN